MRFIWIWGTIVISVTEFALQKMLCTNIQVRSPTHLFNCLAICFKFIDKEPLMFNLGAKHSERSKDRAFSCSQCPLKFHERHKLKTHLRSHSGEKRKFLLAWNVFVSFIPSFYLFLHLIAFSCEFCDRKYTYKGDLNKHRQTHVGDNVYKCGICDKGFRFMVDFNRHSNEHYKQDRDKMSENSNANSNSTQW